ncbi:MAG TPA: hypothetical protein VLJ21_04510 [Candidatus Binatia bacterium]|nr:hypothetical protein [Candidatus Binatia bacterium]
MDFEEHAIAAYAQLAPLVGITATADAVLTPQAYVMARAAMREGAEGGRGDGCIAANAGAFAAHELLKRVHPDEYWDCRKQEGFVLSLFLQMTGIHYGGEIYHRKVCAHDREIPEVRGVLAELKTIQRAAKSITSEHEYEALSNRVVFLSGRMGITLAGRVGGTRLLEYFTSTGAKALQFIEDIINAEGVRN